MADQTIVLIACSVDLGLREVHRGEERHALTEIEVNLLEYLRDRDGVPASRADLLRDVWGYAEGLVTRAVDNTVMRLRQKIEVDARAPDHLLSIRGLGYRLALPELVNGVPTLPEISEFETHLPRPAVSFVGREAEIASLGELFGGGARLVTVVGLGGLGKTRLVRRFAVGQVRGGMASLFCGLAQARSALDVCRELARVLAIDLSGTEEQNRAELGEALKRRGELLLVLDNFEQLDRQSRKLLITWQEQVPELRLLITSRAQLGVRGETVMTLGPLPLDDGVALFRSRANALGVSLELKAEDDAIIGQIVTEIDGLPLAIELAAARCDVLPPSELLTRLQDRFKLLSDHRRSPTDRQASLRATIAWSWDLLQPAEQDAWRQLSTFAGGFSLDAAEAVVKLEPDAPWVLDILQSLSDQSLVQVYRPPEVPDSGRYRMLSSIQAYGRECLAAQSDADAVWSRHVAHFAECAQHWSRALGGPGHATAMAHLSLELDNLVAAHGHAVSSDLGAAVDLMEAAIGGLVRCGPWATASVLLDATQSAADADPLTKARYLLARGRVLFSTGHTGDGARTLEQAAEAAKAAGDEHIRLAAVCQAASARRTMGQHAAGRAALEAALADARSGGLRHAEGIALKDLGALELTDGNPETGRSYLEQALKLLMDAQDLESAARTVAHLGQLDHDAQRLSAGRGFYMRAIELHRTLGNHRFEAIVKSNLALLMHQEDQLAMAEEHYRAGLAVHRAVGNRRFEGFVLGGLGMLAHERGDLADALSLYEESLALFEQVSDPIFAAIGWARIGSIHVVKGRLQQAERAFEHAKNQCDGDARIVAGIEIFEGKEPVLDDALALDGFVSMARRLRAASVSND